MKVKRMKKKKKTTNIIKCDRTLQVHGFRKAHWSDKFCEKKVYLYFDTCMKDLNLENDRRKLLQIWKVTCSKKFQNKLSV